MSLIERYWLERRPVDGGEAVYILVVQAVSWVEPNQVIEAIEEANAIPGGHKIEMHFPARKGPHAQGS